MIEVKNLSKSYGEHRVLDNLSFTIKPGMMTGFVGGNGAGKTTTMRVLLGVAEADSGMISVDGAPISAGYRSRIGYMPEERGLYPKMKVAEQLVYLAQLHGVSRAKATRKSDELLEVLGLGERKNATLEELSLGNQQRAQVAAALVHDPVALILDEPFSGLDPLAVDTTVDVLRQVAETGAPVLFSSHQLDVVERLCDELVIIADGKIVTAGTRDEILAATTEPEWQLLTDSDTGWVRAMPGVEVVEFDGDYVRFQAPDAALAHGVLAEAMTRGAQVHEFSPFHRSLHDIFRETIK